MTTDRDYGELVFRQGRLHSGVILLRLSGLSTSSKAVVASRAVNERAAEYAGAFAVVTPSRVRLRKDPRFDP